MSQLDLIAQLLPLLPHLPLRKWLPLLPLPSRSPRSPLPRLKALSLSPPQKLLHRLPWNWNLLLLKNRPPQPVRLPLCAVSSCRRPAPGPFIKLLPHRRISRWRPLQETCSAIAPSSTGAPALPQVSPAATRNAHRVKALPDSSPAALGPSIPPAPPPADSRPAARAAQVRVPASASALAADSVRVPAAASASVPASGADPAQAPRPLAKLRARRVVHRRPEAAVASSTPRPRKAR